MLAASIALLMTCSAAFADGHAAALILSNIIISEDKVMGTDQVFEGFVVTVFDPDAPTGSGWWHWSVFNIPADVTSLAATTNADAGLPEGAVALKNDYGAVGFGGACPLAGEMHRYAFTVYALPTMLELDGSVSNALLGFTTKSQAIASSKITAVYHR